MDLLVTLDQNYLGPLRVLLGSLFLNDPGEEFHIYMIEEGLTGAQVEELSQLCREAYQEYRRGGISSAAYNAIYTVCLEYAQPR